MKKKWWLLLALGLVGGAAAAVASQAESKLAVQSVRVERGRLEVIVEDDGITRVVERYVVSAPVAGLMLRSDLKVGDEVEQGAVLALIYPAPESSREAQIGQSRLSAAYARRGEAAARVNEIQGRLAQVERELARTRKLAASGAIPSAELEDQELTFKSAQEQLLASKATLSATNAEAAAARAAIIGDSPAKSEEGAFKVLAPASGKVLHLFEENERVVSPGTALLAVGDPGELEVVVDVLSEDAAQIRPKAPVRLENWGQDKTLEAQVTRIEPEAFTKVSTLGVEEQRVNLIASLKDSPPELGIGYRVEAQIVTWSSNDVLSVPTSALFQRNGSWQVFAIVDGKASLRGVRLGHRGSEKAELLEGLEAGTKVIAYPSDQVKEGVLVQP